MKNDDDGNFPVVAKLYNKEGVLWLSLELPAEHAPEVFDEDFLDSLQVNFLKEIEPLLNLKGTMQ